MTTSQKPPGRTTPAKKSSDEAVPVTVRCSSVSIRVSSLRASSTTSPLRTLPSVEAQMTDPFTLPLRTTVPTKSKTTGVPKMSKRAARYAAATIEGGVSTIRWPHAHQKSCTSSCPKLATRIRGLALDRRGAEVP